MQAPPRDVPAPHDIPETLSALQVPGCFPGHRRCGSFHIVSPFHIQEILLVEEREQLGLGLVSSRNQSPFRRPHQQHARPYFHRLPPLLRPPDDGRAKPPLHPPHDHIPPPLPPPRPTNPFIIPPQHLLRLIHKRALLRPNLHPRPPCGRQRHPPLRSLWRRGPDLHLLHLGEVLVAVAGDGDGDEEDADDDVECAVVWASVEWDAVGWRRVGVWGRGGRGLDTEEGEDCEGEGEEGEGDVERGRKEGSDVDWKNIRNVSSKKDMYFYLDAR